LRQINRKTPKILTFLAASMMLFGPKAGGETLYGGAGQTEVSPLGAAINPANAAFIEDLQIELPIGMLSTTTTRMRYPGIKTYTKRSYGYELSSLGGTEMSGGRSVTFVLKLAPWIGGSFMGFVYPGVFKTEMKNIPVYMFGQINEVDMNLKLSNLTYMKAGGGIRHGRALGLGLNIEYIDVKVGGSALPAGEGNKLFDIDGKFSIMNIIGGMRMMLVPQHLYIGGTANLISRHVLSFMPQIGALSQSVDSEKLAESASMNQEIKQNLGQIRGGFKFIIHPLTILGEFVYDAKPSNVTTFSMSELKPISQEVSERFGIIGGGKVDLTRHFSVLGGFNYMPARIGQGNKEEGVSGFGVLDALMAMSGMQQLEPYYTVAGGVELKFNRLKAQKARSQAAQQQRDSRDEGAYYLDDSTNNENSANRYRTIVRFGVEYRKASLGIDEAGYQPAAYEQIRLAIPISIIHRLEW
jgi:hypothetical protein